MQVVELEPANTYQRETYGILYVGKYVHQVTGAKHNPRSLFDVKVWDNSVRPNPCPEGKYTEFGRYGGPGQFLGPDNIGTDAPLSVTMSAEATVISKEASTYRVGDKLAIGGVYHLKAHGGIVSLGVWEIDQKTLADPHMKLIVD